MRESNVDVGWWEDRGTFLSREVGGVFSEERAELKLDGEKVHHWDAGFPSTENGEFLRQERMWLLDQVDR